MSYSVNSLLNIIILVAVVLFVVFKDYASWKRAFFATVKQTKLPFLFRIIGYFFVFVLSGQILKHFGYPDEFLLSVILTVVIVFGVRFCFTLIQEKNKK